jgi:DNA-binding PadR family transcriptional regulator
MPPATGSDPASPLSPQVFQILLSLHAGPQHGYAIIQDVGARTQDEVRLTASTLYDALARLADQGWIEEIAAPRDSPDARRRYYAITRLGRAAAAGEARRLERLVRMARASGVARGRARS